METNLDKINLSEYDLDGFDYKLFIQKDEIQDRVKAIGRQINEDYSKKLPVIIGVLNGSFLFMADLVRHLSIDFIQSFDGSQPFIIKVCDVSFKTCKK